MVPLWAGEGGLGNATLSLGALSRGPGAAHFPEGLPFCWPLTHWARDEASGASAAHWGSVQSDPLLLLRTGCKSLHRLCRGSVPSPPSLSGASPPRPICNTNICPGEHSQGEINHRGAERVAPGHTLTSFLCTSATPVELDLWIHVIFPHPYFPWQSQRAGVKTQALRVPTPSRPLRSPAGRTDGRVCRAPTENQDGS